MRYTDRLLFLNGLSQPEVRKSPTRAFLPLEQGSRAWRLVCGLRRVKPGGRAGRAWPWAMLVRMGCRLAWSTPSSVCAGHGGAQRLQTFRAAWNRGSQAAGPGRACGAAGAEGGGAGAGAGRRHCRPTSVQTVLFARDGFSFKSCVPPLPAPLCRLLVPEPSGTNFQLRRNGDTR